MGRELHLALLLLLACLLLGLGLSLLRLRLLRLIRQPRHPELRNPGESWTLTLRRLPVLTPSSGRIVDALEVCLPVVAGRRVSPRSLGTACWVVHHRHRLLLGL